MLLYETVRSKGSAMSHAEERMLDRRAFLRGLVLTGAMLAGCGGRAEEEAPVPDVEPKESPSAEGEPAPETAPPEAKPTANNVEEKSAMNLTITINGTPFAATADEGQTGQDLLSRLPFSLHMEELHGNEKYCYTGEDFGGEASVPATIYAGDLMVYDDDCLVLFYETHPNENWAYKMAARIKDTSGLEEACGSGSVMVNFSR